MNTVKLGDVAIESRDSLKEKDKSLPVVGLEHLIPEQINITDWNIGQENTFTKTFEKGDVLFGRRRAYLKKAAVAPFKGICSGDITVIRAKEGKILPELLPFVIQNDFFFDYAVGKSAGSLSPRVKWEHLANYEFNLPELDEQKKLAEVLWQIVDTMESYKKLLAKTDEMVKAKFVEMFGTLDNSLFEKKELSKFGDIGTGTTPPMKNKDYYSSNDIPFIKPSDFCNVSVTYLNSSEFFISENARKAARIFPNKTVLVTCIGTIGKVAIVTTESSCNQQINYIIPNNKVNEKYIAYSLLYSKNELQEKANAPVVPILNKSEFAKSQIPLPPLELQNLFAEFVQKSEESKAAIKASLDSLSAVYKKIIAENLGGSN